MKLKDVVVPQKLVGEECSNYLSALTCLRMENLVYGIVCQQVLAESRTPDLLPRCKSHSVLHRTFKSFTAVFRPLFEEIVLPRSFVARRQINEH